MKYKEIRALIDKLAEENYEDFIKAVIGFEQRIDDEQILNKIYSRYIQNDSIALLNDELIDEVSKVSMTL